MFFGVEQDRHIFRVVRRAVPVHYRERNELGCFGRVTILVEWKDIWVTCILAGFAIVVIVVVVVVINSSTVAVVPLSRRSRSTANGRFGVGLERRRLGADRRNCVLDPRPEKLPLLA